MAILKKVLVPENSVEDVIYPKTSVDMIDNIAEVAITNSYNDLNDLPSIPTIPSNLVTYKDVTGQNVKQLTTKDGVNFIPLTNNNQILYKHTISFKVIIYESLEELGDFNCVATRYSYSNEPITTFNILRNNEDLQLTGYGNIHGTDSDKAMILNKMDDSDTLNFGYINNGTYTWLYVYPDITSGESHIFNLSDNVTQVI